MTANPAMDPRTYVPRGSNAQLLDDLRALLGPPAAPGGTTATGSLPVIDPATPPAASGRLHVSHGKDSAELPAQVADALRLLVAALADGRPVTVAPQTHLVTPQEAAQMLGVTKTQLEELMDSGALPYRTIGRHQRILLTDVLASVRRRLGDQAGLGLGDD
ncbi:excisionase family DNA binding protein [Kineosphaera limosa]|uniref:Helix-turn-helix domain-containing protein n=1 Tax=Kineosphaera limosa NBRC 100340 TaxID=1184609 RepID=K6WST7_9MICO|nr:helix-turn-helix domain-containing protein [Kineosphaera limosa]NYE01421.1 excisionase family DNA binding protein [Kineosphaera limosa]GAB95167.1 hypothetical protein KILIM_017_00120 [Kineosphaera limosa NBRC 100340]